MLNRERRSEGVAAMRRALEAFAALRVQRSAIVGFNTFALLNVGTDEVRHSAFLAWLLDPSAGHGQGDLFLEALLATCRPPIDLVLPEQVHVQTEFAGVESIVDIVIYEAGVFVIYIENKTVSPHMPDQHDREFRDLNRLGETLGVPPEARYAIYLTPQGRWAAGDSAAHWRHLAYRELGAAFDALLPEITEAKTRYLVQDWLDTVIGFAGTWRRMMMTGLSPESLLVAEHWNTIQDIIRAKDALDRELTEMLFSIQTDLEAEDWWDEDWQFRRYKNQIYIFNTHWLNPKEWAVVYMGVYSFSAAHALEPGAPPQFYVRVRDGYAALNQTLLERTRAAGHTVSEGHRHFIRRDLQTCAAERQAAESYLESVRQQIVELFRQYATLMLRFDETIREYSAVKDIDMTADGRPQTADDQPPMEDGPLTADG